MDNDETTDTMPTSILVTRDQTVATLTLNRPEKLNALNATAWQQLTERVEELNRDDEIRCVVVRGAGHRSFSAGADIAAFSTERTSAVAREYGELEFGAIKKLSECRHPTVAMIRGVCVGGGVELACACDIRIAAHSSKFGIPINRLGLTLSYDEARFLIGVVGRAAVLDMILEGAVFGVERAQQLGLVYRVVDDAAIETSAYAVAQRIAERAPLVNRWHKKFINRLADPRPLTEAEIAEGYAAFDTDDYQIGSKAFLAKQPPHFRGQ